jgi:hypothetical protein
VRDVADCETYGALCLLFAYPWTLKMEAVRSSETSANYHTRRHIPEDSTFYTQ